jgi:hypothetical protein
LTPKQDDSLGTVTRLEQTVNFLAFTKFYETHALASPILIHSRPCRSMPEPIQRNKSSGKKKGQFSHPLKTPKGEGNPSSPCTHTTLHSLLIGH